MAEPLSGLTVVELCQNVAGPYTGLVLSQLGARVVKVERPLIGDDSRNWGPPYWQDESVLFAVMNAGKDSVTLDVDDPADRESLLESIDACDILLASMRPGSLERRGLGYEQLAARNPRIIMASISGFGSEGPLASEPGYDPLIQAFGGLMSITGDPHSPPVRVGTSMIDMGTSLWTVIGILAALRHRERTGKGTHLTGSLLETGIAWLPYQIVGYLATGSEPDKHGSGLPMVVPYQAFNTADRPIVVAAGNDRLWTRLCMALDRQDLLEDESLATNPQRVVSRERVVEELSATLAQRSAKVWERRLRTAGVPCAPVQRISEVVTHPQVQALQMLAEVEHPEIHGFTLPGLPFRLDGWRPRPAGPPPPLGGDRPLGSREAS